jgi:hypothetical protein
MKTFATFLVLLFAASAAMAQHNLQIDDGTGNTLGLAPPSGMTGSTTYIFPKPPSPPVEAGFIGVGSNNGQLAVWNNPQKTWGGLPNGSNGMFLQVLSGIPAWGMITASNLPNLQNMNGLLDFAHGGTGQTSANAALNAMLPAQAPANNGMFLQTNGSNTSWSNGPTAYESWNLSTTDATITTDNAYINNKGAVQAVYTLPLTAAVGTKFQVVGYTSGGWKIAQNAGQVVHYDALSTTAGAAGFVASASQYSSIEAVCVVANLEWVIYSVAGSITVN